VLVISRLRDVVRWKHGKRIGAIDKGKSSSEKEKEVKDAPPITMTDMVSKKIRATYPAPKGKHTWFFPETVYQQDEADPKTWHVRVEGKPALEGKFTFDENGNVVTAPDWAAA